MEESETVRRSRSRIYFLNMLIVFVQAVQMYHYYRDVPSQVYLQGLLTIWGCSKLLCIMIQLSISQNCSFKDRCSMTLRALFLSEYISLAEQLFKGKDLVKSWLLGTVGQIHVYALPVFIVNNYIIIRDESNVGVETQMYVIMIVNIIVISFCNLLVQSVRNKLENVQQPFLFSTMSFCRCFLFWHILGQLYSLNYIILLVWLFTHLFISCVITSYSHNSESRLACFVCYLFQLQLFQMKPQTNNKSKLQTTTNISHQYLQKNWYEIVYFLLLQLNLLLFVFIKVIMKPLMVKMDYFIYILFPFLIPSFVWTIETLYNKALKIENYNEIVGWKAGQLNLCKTIYRLRDHLLFNGKIYIELDGIKQYKNQIRNQRTASISPFQVSNTTKSQINSNISKDVLEIKRSLKIAAKGSFKNLDIQLYDLKQSIQIIFSFENSNDNYTQKITLSPTFDEDLVVDSLDVIQHAFNPQKEILFEGSKKDILRIRFKTIRFNSICYHQQEKQQELVLQVVASNFSALTLYKYFSLYLPINPSLVLYDLLEESI